MRWERMLQKRHSQKEREQYLKKGEEFIIKHRYPRIGDIPVPYVRSRRLEILLEGTERDAKRFLKKGDADIQNEEFYDQIINDIKSWSDQETESQRIMHQRAILSIEEGLRTNLSQLKKRQAQLQAAYDKNGEELKQIEAKKD